MLVAMANATASGTLLISVPFGTPSVASHKCCGKGWKTSVLSATTAFAGTISQPSSRVRTLHVQPLLALPETLAPEVEPVSESLKSESESGELDAESGELSTLKSESDLLKKRAKRAELRRKRLVRKRRLRKKGRWPPSKLAKNKNV